MNNLNDGMAWGLFPLFFAAANLSLDHIGILGAIYPATWGVVQLATGALSDRVGRKWLSGGTCAATWSADGRFLYVDLGAPTFAIPVPPGKSLPDLPSAGISSDGEPPGARAMQRGALSPGANPSTYVFRRTELHANLFRIPLH